MSTTDRITAPTIEKEHYYHGLLPREDIMTLLTENGDYVIRMTEPKAGEPRQYILSVMYNKTLPDDLRMKHYIIKFDQNGFTIDDTNRFISIQKLVDFHKKNRKTAPNCAEPLILIRPIMRQSWELDHESVVIQKKLGEGAFGEVSMGELRQKGNKVGGKPVKVAVKQAKIGNMTKEQIKEFMREARIMRPLSHPHVVKFYGVAAGEEPLYMVMELASNGSLDGYLKKNPDLSLERYNEMVLQAAWGIEYLHTLSIIHRDIAARNCLYGDRAVKISDFGLSRPGPVYNMDPKKNVPIRWLAIETLTQYVYTYKTDVWSFGVLAWEIYSKGVEPYPEFSVAQVNQQVRGGYRMEFPQTVNPEVAKTVLERCWCEDPNMRFTMPELVQFLKNFFGMRNPTQTPNKTRIALLQSSKRRMSKPSKTNNWLKKGGMMK